MRPLRLVFLGSDRIALPVLNTLLSPAGRALVSVAAVYTQPDRPHGRGQKLQPGPVKEWALAQDLPVYQPERLTPADAARVAQLADVALVMAYGQLLKDDFLAAPRLGVFNLHTSLLPRYRGASPVTAAIANGDRETGVTFMRLVRKLDAGAIAGAARIPIGPEDTTGTIETALGEAAAPLTLQCLAELAEDRLSCVEQAEAQVSYCRRLSKDDGVLDFAQPAAVLARRINALQPWPGCATDVGGTPVKLGLADMLAGPAAGAPGEVVGADGNGLLVATVDGVLRLRRLQRPGGKMLPAVEFLRGFPVARGTMLPSRPMPALIAREPFPRV